MPGPKMGARPPDFNETSLKQSPTYIKWLSLQDGEKLRYACREFIKGQEQDDERLLRRIMIARRNNIRDHETLKVARLRGSVTTLNTTATHMMIPRRVNERNNSKISTKKAAATDGESSSSMKVETDHTTDCIYSNNVMGVVDAPPAMFEPTSKVDVIASQPPTTNTAGSAATTTDDTTTPTISTSRARRPPHTFTDAQVEQEMDVMAVQKTRSYRNWMELVDGTEFVYNQKYVKGREGHDWLLRKNIWRRMRYRRENKQLVLEHHQQGKGAVPIPTANHGDSGNHRISVMQQATIALQPPKQLLRSTITAGMNEITTEATNDGSTTNLVALVVDTSTACPPTAHASSTDNNTNDDTTTASAAAAAVAAAQAAVSFADEAAVEAAVAAAESHFHRQQQQQVQDQDDVADIDVSQDENTVTNAAMLDEDAIAAAAAVAAAVVVAQSSSTSTTASSSPAAGLGSTMMNNNTNDVIMTNCDIDPPMMEEDETCVAVDLLEAEEDSNIVVTI